MSASQAITQSKGKKRKVITPSHHSTTFGEIPLRMMSNHTYAMIEKTAVM